MEAEKLKEILGIEGTEQDEKVEAAIAAINEETENLVKTKDKLREQVRDLDKRLKAFKDVDLEEIESMRTELEELREAAEGDDGGDGKPRKISADERKAIEDRATKKLQEQLDALQTKLDTVQGKYHGTLTQNEVEAAIESLDKALEKAGTPLLPSGRRYLKKVLPNEANIVYEGDTPSVMIKTKDEISLSIGEYLQDWTRSDEAKDFIKGPDNSGGGARGGSGGGAKKTVTRAQFDAMSQKERTDFTLEGGKPVD